jgi:modulator of FtsH protease HflC
MKNPTALLVAFIVLAVLAVYMFWFQVRYDEVAVVTRFNSAEKGRLINEAGMRFEPLPWPFTKVYKYSTRLQILEDHLEQVQTADGYSVAVQTYVAWRIHDPMKFFTRLENVPNAQRSLQGMMSDLRGIISQYRFDELANTSPERMQLETMEARAAERLQQRVDAQDYGVTIEGLGIRRVVLPEAVTSTVFERMRKTRERLAEQARSTGDAEASFRRSEARSARDRILAFAERRAQAIRAQGDHEAASYYGSFASDEDFAIFLRKLEALKAMLKKHTTFVLDAKDITPLDMFVHDPARSVQPVGITQDATAGH